MLPRTRREPKPFKPLEKDVQAAVIDYLRLFGAKVIRINSGAMQAENNGRKRFVRFNSEPGCSDILAVLPGGRFGAFEVKRPGWRQSPTDAHEREQADFLASVRDRGGVGVFVTGIDSVRDALRDNGYDAP